VAVVVGDRRMAVDTDTDLDVDYFEAEILSARDFYPFGMVMPERSFSTQAYRYGFNGKEFDSEWKGEGNSYDYGFRVHDARLGRFLSVDPLAGKFSYNSPYAYATNNPILFIDSEGKEIKIKGSEDAKERFKKMISMSFSGLIYAEIIEGVLTLHNSESNEIIKLKDNPELAQELGFNLEQEVLLKMLDESIHHTKTLDFTVLVGDETVTPDGHEEITRGHIITGGFAFGILDLGDLDAFGYEVTGGENVRTILAHELSEQMVKQFDFGFKDNSAHWIWSMEHPKAVKLEEKLLGLWKMVQHEPEGVFEKDENGKDIGFTGQIKIELREKPPTIGGKYKLQTIKIEKGNIIDVTIEEKEDE
jgi:RHS repeat-associated protein